MTTNEPYWGNYGTTEANGYVELDFGAPKTFDNVKVWFVSDRQAGGYQRAAEVLDPGAGRRGRLDGRPRHVQGAEDRSARSSTRRCSSR